MQDPLKNNHSLIPLQQPRSISWHSLYLLAPLKNNTTATTKISWWYDISSWCSRLIPLQTILPLYSSCCKIPWRLIALFKIPEKLDKYWQDKFWGPFSKIWWNSPLTNVSKIAVTHFCYTSSRFEVNHFGAYPLRFPKWYDTWKTD